MSVHLAVIHIAAQKSSDNLPSNSPDKYHHSGVVKTGPVMLIKLHFSFGHVVVVE